MNGFVAACLDWEAAEKAKVDVATWGHLAPKPQHKYKGTLVFACGLYQRAASFQTWKIHPGNNEIFTPGWTPGRQSRNGTLRARSFVLRATIKG
jgi:hypothetical protein